MDYTLLDIDFLQDYDLENEKIENVSSEIIFSLTSIPTRFIHKQFEKTIQSLYNQTYKPKYIIINLCNVYNRNFDYDKNTFESKIQYYKQNYDNIIINFSEDYGPITKILGLYKMHDFLKPEDKIIVIDDDVVYKPSVTYYYDLAYQMYNCDSVFIDELQILPQFLSDKNVYNIFYDNYKNFVYGWLSFSFKYKFINKLYDFYQRVKIEDESIINHDDLILTLFYKLHNLYACGINLIFPMELEVDSIVNVDSLSSTEIAKPFRYNLEKTFCKKYKIHFYNRKLSYHKSNITINETILPRTILYNISNLQYDPNKNNFHFKQIDLKYFNKNVFVLTLTYFNDDVYFTEPNNQKKIYLQMDKEELEIELKINYRAQKQSYFIQIKKELQKIEHKNYSFNIFQTFSNRNNLHVNKFYSINSILSLIPDMKYEFFDNIRQLEYLYNKNKKLITFLNKVIPGSYKADLFRAVYLYYEGGIYFDCKNILYSPIDNLLSKQKSLCEYTAGKLYNGNLFFSTPNNQHLKNYILKVLENIKYDLYDSNYLSVTGGHLLSNYINDDIYLKNSYDNDDWISNHDEFNKSDKWQRSFVVEIETGKIILKTSYYNYYLLEDTRIDYVDLYNKKQIYSPIVITHEIDNILD